MAFFVYLLPPLQGELFYQFILLQGRCPLAVILRPFRAFPFVGLRLLFVYAYPCHPSHLSRQFSNFRVQ